MKVKSFIGLFVACLALIVSNPASAPAQTPGSSPSLAVSKGITLEGIMECGEGYTSHELYDLKMTLLEVIRGEEAWKRISEASASNKPAKPESEYILARLRLEYFARGTPGLCTHEVVPEQFTAYSANGEDYTSALVMPPKPELRKGMKSGESLEGWVAFVVAQNDKAPLLSYSADAGGAVQHGGGRWFQLK
jgi:hypothetical protein